MVVVAEAEVVVVERPPISKREAVVEIRWGDRLRFVGKEVAAVAEEVRRRRRKRIDSHCS